MLSSASLNAERVLPFRYLGGHYGEAGVALRNAGDPVEVEVVMDTVLVLNKPLDLPLFQRLEFYLALTSIRPRCFPDLIAQYRLSLPSSAPSPYPFGLDLGHLPRQFVWRNIFPAPSF